MDAKYNQLLDFLSGFTRLGVSFSGGVDSTFLLFAAKEALGAENVRAYTGVSASLAQAQRLQAKTLAKDMGISHREILLDELSDPDYAANRADRCFHCKSHQLREIIAAAKDDDIDTIVCGTNFDDMDDYRPGNRAVQALGVKAPLMDAKLTKAEIRTLSRRFNLDTADMPASPCLSSRVAYGLEITEDRLAQVEAAEAFLHEMGIPNLRVRHHGNTARIELPVDKIQWLCADGMRQKVVEKLKALGFEFVCLDLEGFKSGSLNRMLTDAEKHKAVKE